MTKPHRLDLARLQIRPRVTTRNPRVKCLLSGRRTALTVCRHSAPRTLWRAPCSCDAFYTTTRSPVPGRNPTQRPVQLMGRVQFWNRRSLSSLTAWPLFQTLPTSIIPTTILTTPIQKNPPVALHNREPFQASGEAVIPHESFGRFRASAAWRRSRPGPEEPDRHSQACP